MSTNFVKLDYNAINCPRLDIIISRVKRIDVYLKNKRIPEKSLNKMSKALNISTSCIRRIINIHSYELQKSIYHNNIIDSFECMRKDYHDMIELNKKRYHS